MKRAKLAETALLVVDVQRGFSELCPSELPVQGALAIVPRINALMTLPWARIDASQDWHPAGHCSFLGQRDNLYPAHCIMNTPGSEFLPGLRTEQFHAIWRKGFMRDMEAYSVTEQHPAMIGFFRECGVRGVAVCGIATNICCFYAARDFKMAGFDVWMVEDACVGVDMPAANMSQARTKLEGKSMGIEYVGFDSIKE